MSESMPPEVKRRIKQQEQAEVLNPVDTEKHEHSLRNTAFRRNVEVSYMQAMQHQEDNE
ncbi:MAG: hypothetical protein ACYC5Y_09815 [Symbiobacteriia bacterium]